jgi:hypothetical protein
VKYLSSPQISEALQLLTPFNVLFGTTFLVLKREKVPVGKKIRFPLDAANHEFLEQHYRVHPKSRFFFRVLRQGDPNKDWNRPDYAGKGLQSVNTRGTTAFLHDKNDNTWGFASNYVEALREKLPRGRKVPLFQLAAWMYRDRTWKDETNRSDIVRKFVSEYHLTPKELENLFERQVISKLTEEQAFQPLPTKWHEILSAYSPPQDAPPEESGILQFLELEGVGPSQSLRFEPAKRLNIITGDNGLGKSFLLDVAWWALTREWAGHKVLPSSSSRRPNIKFVVASGVEARSVRASFSRASFEWELPKQLPAVSGLVIYARVDGSFAVWDPANRSLMGPSRDGQAATVFTREQVWEGKSKQILGLIHDWVRWQERPDKGQFDTFRRVLKRVSPPDLGELTPGEPTRIPGEISEIPTLVHPYDTVPITLESAGIKRIITLAYLIVWAWEEHKIQARQSKRPEERQMVVIVDEAEAHLHPKWQRVLLPALLGIAADLSAELSMQLIVATHSPLVLASSEAIFDSSQDKLFHLDMSVGGVVSFRPVPFELRGSADSWLTSSLFDLRHPGSREAELAIREAVRLQEAKAATPEQVKKVSEKLSQHLAAEDPFWVRWVFFAEKHGVKL